MCIDTKRYLFHTQTNNDHNNIHNMLHILHEMRRYIMYIIHNTYVLCIFDIRHGC